MALSMKRISLNVGVNHIVSACPAWYPVADVIASKLIMGKCPQILETIELVLVDRQDTNIINLFGEEDAAIDLSKNDLFVKIIELRTEFKQRRDLVNDKTSGEYKRFDAIQIALKCLASATSYGILVEFIVDERKKPTPKWSIMEVAQRGLSRERSR